MDEVLAGLPHEGGPAEAEDLASFRFIEPESAIIPVAGGEPSAVLAGVALRF